MNNNQKPMKPSKPGSFNRYFHPFRYKIMKDLRGLIGTLLLAGVVYMLLSGVINQVKTGETIVNYLLRNGRKVGNFIESLFTSDSPLRIDENGIYFKDSEVPDESAIPERGGLDIETFKS